jgi:Asp/Glu/hydantoin racemase
MLTACMLGRTFGVLVFINELVEQITENAAHHGLAGRLTGVRHVGFQFADVLAAFTDPTALIERFRSAARGLIAQGAEVIIPGEAPLNVLLATHGVNEVDGVPVLDSLGAWVKQAEAMVDLRRANGTSTCNRGYFSAQPAPERMREVFEFYGLTPFLQGGAQP